MAISFTRPDPSSPSSVASASFTTARKGFEPAEVREFLRMVAAELARLQERERFLERELRTSQRSAAPTSVALDEDLVTKMLGEEAARILHTARDAAANIKVRSEEGAARLLREATDEAQRLREEAEIEAARRRTDATADAEAELEMAKQQGREMVNEARAYRERVLNELARRREIARQQIEQLVHGRDRLLQAFERSRLVAVDVMAELTPLVEPSEYVNLSPITGPVPLMVKDMPRPPERATSPAVRPLEQSPLARSNDTDDDRTPDTDTDATVALTVARVVPLVESSIDAAVDGPSSPDAAATDETDQPDLLGGEPTVTIFVDDDFDTDRRSIDADGASDDADVHPSLAGPRVIDDVIEADQHENDEHDGDADDADDRVIQLDISPHDPSTVDAGDDREPAPVVALFAAEVDRRRAEFDGEFEAEVEVEFEPDASLDIEPVDTDLDDLDIDAEVDEIDEIDEIDVELVEIELAQVDPVEEATASTTSEPDDDPVEELPPAARRIEPIIAEPVSAEPVDPDATTVLRRPSADDLFARLRAARAESVAERAIQTSKSGTSDPTDDIDVVEPVVRQDRQERPERQRPASNRSVTSPVTEPPRARSTEPSHEVSVFTATPDAPSVTVTPVDSPFARRDEALTPLIIASARKLKRVLADEQNEVLHALRRKEPVRDLGAMLASEREQAERYGSAIAAELIAAAAAGAVSMGMDASTAQREAKQGQVTASAIDALSTDMVQPLRERLARCVSDADGDNVELATLVRHVYREWKNQRIDEHLDDVARAAFGRGALAGVVPGTRICWMVDPEGPACADAEDNALGGAVAAGEPFPTDHPCAPAHRGCRCMIAPAD